MEKVLGIGNALMDVLIPVESDEWLKRFSLPKGSMQLVDKNCSRFILTETAGLSKKQAAGGSAANTINGLANLGLPTGFIGKTGNDEYGRLFFEDMTRNGITPHLLSCETETGCAIALISPDSERTFATFLGAATELAPDDLSPSLFKDYQYLHLEGYLVQNNELMITAAKYAENNNMIISIDLASFNVVSDHREFLNSFIRQYVDIVFANEEEARAFTGESPEKALSMISDVCNIAVVKTGSSGSLIKSGKNIYPVKAIKANCIDTTGAGDLYAAGFLYGLAMEYPLLQCGETASLLAGKVIEVTGAKIDDSKWKEIRSQLRS